MDLQGDEELEALRLAALATLKTNPSKKRDVERSAPVNISKVSTLITSKSTDQQNDQHVGSVYGNQQSWKNSQLSRRGRGRQFPFVQKGNQRSNLIVITPVNLCEKPDEKETLRHLVLPQHKWCQSVNEDSSSPKSDRRIGPTRFNRHGSDSESSEESDYENSDNDSYSNDTVLQDEPSEPFSTFTPEENTEDERLVEKQAIPERRLSFHKLDSQDKKAESFCNSRKDVYLNNLKEETKAFKAVPEENKSKHEKEFSDSHNVNSDDDKHINKLRSHSPIQFNVGQKSISINGGSHSKKGNLSNNHMSLEKDSYKYNKKQAEEFVESDSHRNLTTCNSKSNSKNLSECDLRFEIKKRMQDKPFKAIGSQSQNNSFDHHGFTEENRNRVRLRRSHSSEDSDHSYKHRSRSYRSHDRKNESQGRSSPENDNSTSSVRNNVSSYHTQADASKNKREHSHSSERSYKRSRSQSLERGSATQSRGRRKHSRSSSSSTSSSTSRSSSRSPKHRLVSSVVKPVARTDESRTRSNDNLSEKRFVSTELNSNVVFKRFKNSEGKPKTVSSTVKSSICGSEKSTVNAPDTVKRVPVHMRLGTLPHKRIIRMTKDVEAAFVCTSSDEDTDVNMKYKKQNYRVVTELSGNKLDEVSKRHVEKTTCRNGDVFKGRRTKIER